MFGENSYSSCVNSTDSVISVIMRGFRNDRNLEDIVEIQNASEIVCRMPECMDNLNNYVSSCDIAVSTTIC